MISFAEVSCSFLSFVFVFDFLGGKVLVLQCFYLCENLC